MSTTTFKPLGSYTTLSQFRNMIGNLSGSTIDLRIDSFWKVTFIGNSDQTSKMVDESSDEWNVVFLVSDDKTPTSLMTIWRRLGDLEMRKPDAAVVILDPIDPSKKVVNKTVGKIVTNVVTKVVFETKDDLLCNTTMNRSTDVYDFVDRLASEGIQRGQLEAFYDCYGSHLGGVTVFKVDNYWISDTRMNTLFPYLFVDPNWRELFTKTEGKCTLYECLIPVSDMKKEFGPRPSRIQEVKKQHIKPVQVQVTEPITKEPVDVACKDLPPLEPVQQDPSALLCTPKESARQDPIPGSISVPNDPIPLSSLIPNANDAAIAHKVVPLGGNRYQFQDGVSVYEKIGVGLVLIGQMNDNNQIVKPKENAKAAARVLGIKVLDTY